LGSVAIAAATAARQCVHNATTHRHSERQYKGGQSVCKASSVNIHQHLRIHLIGEGHNTSFGSTGFFRRWAVCMRATFARKSTFMPMRDAFYTDVRVVRALFLSISGFLPDRRCIGGMVNSQQGTTTLLQRLWEESTTRGETDE
jgi:hypothetical protein